MKSSAMVIKYRFNKVFLIVLDGFGLAQAGPGNAIALAGMSYLNKLCNIYPAFSVIAAGLTVGLPWGKYGNSEVGHSTMGAGRVVIQDLARINNAIRNGDFFQNPAFLNAVRHCQQNNSALHLIGCFSAGGIHAHQDHAIALLRLAARNGLQKIFLHIITDGQDVGPQDAHQSLTALTPILKETGAQIASISGRSYGMDRILNWPLTAKAWQVMVDADGPVTGDVLAYLADSYAQGIFDQNIVPRRIASDPAATVSDNDAVIFFNYRNDRAKQLVAPFVRDDFTDFARKKLLKNLNVVTMTHYADDLAVAAAFMPLLVTNTLGEVLAKQGIKQYRIAEKEKEAHVTNFFNGGKITPWIGEDRIILPSHQLAEGEYINHPEMVADLIARTVLEHKDDEHRFFLINFANADMIGHTGDQAATVKALKILDRTLEQMVDQIITNPEYAVVITADHGNAEELLDPANNTADTQHSTNHVPIIFVANWFQGVWGSGKTLESLNDEDPLGTLADVAPSVLHLLDLAKPQEMAGSTLVTSKIVPPAPIDDEIS